MPSGLNKSRLTQQFPSGDLSPIGCSTLYVALHWIAHLQSLRLKLLQGLIIGFVASRAKIDDAPLQGSHEGVEDLEGEIEVEGGEKGGGVLLESDVSDGDGWCCHCG